MIQVLALTLLLAPGASAGPQWTTLPGSTTTQTVESSTDPLPPGPTTRPAVRTSTRRTTAIGSIGQPGTGSGGTFNSSGGPGSWNVTSSGISSRPDEPPPPTGIPPEAKPDGSQSLLFYTVSFKGGPNGTGTGYSEDFMVYAPDQSKPRPMLVAFHKYGVSQNDIWINTRFFQEAVRRKWHIIAPLSASGVHMGSQEGQKNTEDALDWMMANFNIDRDRIYGVGFSMGGGAVANFAARHLDHNRYAFAAIFDHTGGIAHWDTYAQSPGTQFVFDFWFEDPNSPGELSPFLMAQACLLDFDPNTLVVKLNNNLARNLVTVPTKVTRASLEPLSTAYLQKQCDIFVNHLMGLGGTVIYEIVPFFGHTWAMLDEREVVDWLGVHRLKVPATHRTLADSNRRYWHFDVTQDAGGDFTPFLWTVDTVANSLTLQNTRNLTRLGVDMASAGLLTDQPFTVTLSTTDNLSDEVALQGWPTTPTTVHRDGVQQFVNWTYQSTEQLLTLQEWDGTTAHTWVVTP